MNIKVKSAVFKQFPKLNLGFVLAKKINNNNLLRESKHLLREAELMTHLTFHKRDVKNNASIAPWAIIQQKLGVKAKHQHTSVERLISKVLKQEDISAKDPLTNLVRYLSIKRIVPMAVDDYDLIKGNLTFALASGKERAAMFKKVKKGNLYYGDNQNVLGTKFDYWKSKKTALTKKSTAALIHLEALPPITRKKINEHLKEMKNLVKSFCGGEVRSFVLNKRKRSVKI